MVASRALEVFWTRGYDATSIEDLTAATGLSPSSLYAAFGSKLGVLEAALERYDREMDSLLNPLQYGSAGLADVEQFLLQVRRVLAGKGAHACLMVNTTAEVAARHPRIRERTDRYRNRLRRGLAAALRRAAAHGEIEPGTATDRARLTQACLYGALVTARSGATTDALATLDALAHQFHRRPDREPPADEG